MAAGPPRVPGPVVPPARPALPVPLAALTSRAARLREAPLRVALDLLEALTRAACSAAPAAAGPR